jgi:hypothetical protein
MVRWLILVLLLFPCAAHAVAHDGMCAASASSCTFSSVTLGDLEIIFAYRSGSTTAPSLPSGWTSIATVATPSGGTTGAARIGCKVSLSSSDTGSGTWTNASEIVGESLSGTSANAVTNCNTLAVGSASSNNAEASTTVTFNSLTPKIINGSSWIVGFAGSNQSVSSCTPSGMTAVTNATNAIINDTDGGATSFSSGTCTIASGTWISYVLEVTVAPLTADLSQTNGRAYNTNNGRMYASGSANGRNYSTPFGIITTDLLWTGNASAVGTTITTTIANSSIIATNCSVGSSCKTQSVGTGFTVGANQPACNNLGPVSVNGGGPATATGGPALYAAQGLTYNNIEFANVNHNNNLILTWNGSITNVTEGHCRYFGLTGMTYGDDYDSQLLFTLLGHYIVAPQLNTSYIGSANYTSGGSISGSASQTCHASWSSGTGSIALTGTNTIASGTAFTVLTTGSNVTSPVTSATLSSGTATCSGTAKITSQVYANARLESDISGTQHSATNIPIALPGYYLLSANLNLTSGAGMYGTYTSGCTVTGSAGQFITLSFTGSTGAGTGYVVLTGTNAIASGTFYYAVPTGSGLLFSGTNTSAICGNGTAAATGTATVTSALSGLGTLNIHNAQTGALIGTAYVAAGQSTGDVFDNAYVGNNENETGSTNDYMQNWMVRWTNIGPQDDIYANW